MKVCDSTIPEVEYETPCMKTLTIKILARCWSNEYQSIRQHMERVLMDHNMAPETASLRELIRASARQKISTTLLTLEGRKDDTELFLSLLELRSLKEIASCKEQIKICDCGTESDYLLSSLAAWEHIYCILDKDR